MTKTCSHKNEDQYREVIKTIVARGVSIIDHFMQELDKTPITEEMVAKTPNDPMVLRGQLTVRTIALINDVIHPAYKVCKDFCPEEALPFIDSCIMMHEIAKSKKIIPNCDCCPTNKVI